MEPREILTLTNPNKGWVVNELGKLQGEWAIWLETVRHLPDSPDYNPQTCSEAIKDGFANRRSHDVLREKTLVFIGNNISGYAFIFENWPSYPHEDNAGRLVNIVPSWIHRLEILFACIEYARVPDSFWKAKAKQLVDEVIKTTPDKAVDIAAAVLKTQWRKGCRFLSFALTPQLTESEACETRHTNKEDILYFIHFRIDSLYLFTV
jgi:hypothetical protein